MLQLKLRYSGRLMCNADTPKTVMLGKTEDKKKGQQRMRWSDSITDSRDMNLSKLLELAEDRGAWHAAGHGTAESRT